MKRTAEWMCRAGAGLTTMAVGAWQPEQPAPHPQPAETYQPVRDAKPVALVPSRSVIGSEVRGSGGETIGQINELVLSRVRGRIAFAMVAHGGVLGIGEKVTPVPFNAFDYDKDRAALTLSLSRERLAAAPTMDPKDWETLADPARTEPIYSFFETIRARPAEEDDPDARPGNTPRLSPGVHPLLRTADLRGNAVATNDGRDLGAVDEFVIDAESGRIALVVITLGGVAGIGSERVPMPWPVFDVNRDGRLYAIDVDKEQLASAPRPADKTGAELKQPEFAARVYRHFGRTAAWLERTIGPPVNLTGLTGRTDRPGSPGAYDRLCTRGQPRNITGTITSVEEASPMDGVPKIVMVSVNTGAGEPTRVHLAPKSYLDQNSIAPMAGQQVSLRGRDAEIDGRRCVIATEYTAPSGTTVGLRLSDGSSTWQWK